MPLETLNGPMMIALCRYRGILKGGTSERCGVDDLRKLGAVLDHAEEDEFLEGFLAWILELARKDLVEAGYNHYSKKPA
jgi:hypothetical protein